MFILCRSKKGFTLIELIVVIAIIAILAAIAVPAFTGLTQQATEQAEKANAAMIAQALNVFVTLNPDYFVNTGVGPDIKPSNFLGDLMPVMSAAEEKEALRWLSYDFIEGHPVFSVGENKHDPSM